MLSRYDKNNFVHDYKKVDDIINANHYSDKVEMDQWEKTTASTMKTRVIMIVAAVVLLIATVINYNYLGGLEGIMAGKRLLEEGMTSYICAVGSLVIMPAVAAVLMWRGFRKKK